VSFKLLQFSPQESTRIIRIQAIPEQWSGPEACSSDIGFLKLWVEDEQTIVGKRINWGAISGLALSLAVSAGFWMLVGVTVEKAWK
jgi:hypothetical protein